MNKAMSTPFLRLYALALLFFSANSILNVIVPLRIEALGASNGDIGFIMGAYMFTCMFFRPWAGHLVHKHGPVIVLRILLAVNGLALVLYTFTGMEGYMAARVMQGICTAFFSMALQMGIIDALPEKERSQGLSLYSLFTYMPTIIGPLIAVGIWDLGGMNGFTVAMFVIALATGLFGYSVPMQFARQQGRGNAEPEQGSAEPERENVEQGRGSAEPERENVEQGRRNAEPEQENAEQGRGNAEPEQENAEPEQENAKQGRENAEQRQENAKHGQRDAEQRQENAEHSQRDAEQRQENAEHGQGNTVQKQGNAAAAQERLGLRGALSRIAGNRPLLICSLLMLLASIVFGAVTAFIPLYARQISYGHAGVFLMIQAGIIVAARFTFSKRIPSDGKWHAWFVGAICLIGSVGALLLSLSQTMGPVVFYAAAVLIGIAQAILYPTLTTYLTFVLPGASRNVYIGLFIATADLGISMGGMAMGPIADRFSFSTMYAVSAAVGISAACIALLNRSMGGRRLQQAAVSE
ncbi:staphylopine family metallophore export MFS transporter CntE [Paenibacillus plantiphilus]|uniref:staphylopine family metallophore export MFS transporter CntE n=1 Tax=Paenibacillus plantiphilus TaxID=2905650 RepID=UPI001F36A75C|nr:MFS transporter [Paenibacillus plantiphilus]